MVRRSVCSGAESGGDEFQVTLYATLSPKCSLMATFNALSEFSVVSSVRHLPCIGARCITQRLGFIFAVGVLVVTDTRTEFKTQAVHRPIEELTTITRSYDITLAIAVVAVSQPTRLPEQVVLIGHVVSATSAYRVFLR